ncbi:MAG TPA: hypothetical protein VFY02_02450, partial [Gaiellaceae bacterium]|nr:hypothetical protein [Gaiellaceae bacterium]
MRIVIALAAAALVASSTAAATADTTATCADAAYAYAGVRSSVRTHGIRTVLTPLVEPTVASGHVAAWIGVGGRDAGPNGEPEWIQVGVNAVPGRGLRLYYEWMRPGEPRAYGELGEALPGTSYVLAVVETARDTWQVRVGGRAVLPPVQLPGSSRAWHPIATAEARNDGAADCNSFA